MQTCSTLHQTLSYQLPYKPTLACCPSHTKKHLMQRKASMTTLPFTD